MQKTRQNILYSLTDSQLAGLMRACTSAREFLVPPKLNQNMPLLSGSASIVCLFSPKRLDLGQSENLNEEIMHHSCYMYRDGK